MFLKPVQKNAVKSVVYQGIEQQANEIGCQENKRGFNNGLYSDIDFSLQFYNLPPKQF